MSVSFCCCRPWTFCHLTPYTSVFEMASRDNLLYGYPRPHTGLRVWYDYKCNMAEAEDVLDVDGIPGAVKVGTAFFFLPPAPGHNNDGAIGKLLWQHNIRRSTDSVQLQVFLPMEVLTASQRSGVEPLSCIEVVGMTEVVETMQV